MKLSRTMKIDLLWALLGGVLAVVVSIYAVSCRPTASPNAGTDSGSVLIAPPVDSTCTFLTGVTQTQTVISICAVVEEIAQVIDLIARFRQIDDGHPPVSLEALTCFAIPGDKLFCATPQEIGAGISAVLQTRQARLTRDAGARL